MSLCHVISYPQSEKELPVEKCYFQVYSVLANFKLFYLRPKH